MSQMTLDGCLDVALLGMAERVSKASLDPSTKAGCVLAAAGGYVLGKGYNSFPRGVHITSERLKDRALKYPMTVHAEINALLDARLALADGVEFTAYLHPMPPCAPCAGALIQAGCVRIVARHPDEDQIARWGVSFAIMETMLIEAGVRLDYTN